MLPSTSSREALLTCHPFPSWNLPSFTMVSTLSSPCSCSDPPFSCQDAALAHLDSLPPHDLVLWTDSSVPISFGKGSSGVLVFPLKPAPFYTPFAGLGSANKSAIFLLFFCLTLVQSSPPCSFLHLSSHLKLCGRSGRNCLLSPPVLSGYNGSPDALFSWGTTRLTS